MKKRVRKIISSWVCIILCVSMNINPLAIVAGAVVDSGIVDRFVNLKNNLIWLAETSGGTECVFAADDNNDEVNFCNCEFTCDAIEAINQLEGSGSVTLTDLKNAIDTHLNETNGQLHTTDGRIINMHNMISQDLTTIHGDLDSIETRLDTVNKSLQTIHSDLQILNSTVENMQHNYRVAHLYSLNNSMANALWRPYSSEVDYVDDIAAVTGQFANVYTGYWDTAVTTLTNTSNIVNDNVQTKRVFEILGYDAIIRSEGIVLLKDAIGTQVTDGRPTSGGSGHNMTFNLTSDGASPNSVIITSLFQEIIPENDICWIDAVTLLYKALGQEQVSYQSFMSRDFSITPETSPAFQGLSNPVAGSDGTYQGYDFYMFLTRGNVISLQQAKSGDVEIPSVDIDYIYWRKALNGGFIPADRVNSARDPITFSEFFVLASKMMQAYGEPVMNDSELKALLQVYGTHYPIQLGEKVADGWAYLAARGILDVSEYTEGSKSLLYDISNTGHISRDQLLLMCMRIKDEDSRTNYKTIDVVLNLSDVMQDDYYYPVYDMAVANGQFSVAMVYNHKEAPCYDYLIWKTEENTLGEVGTPMVYSSTEISNSNLIDGATVDPNFEYDNNHWYHVSVPKDYTGNIYIAMHLEDDAALVGAAVKYIEIPSNNALGGGIYTKLSNSGDNNEKIAIVNGEVEWYSFNNYMSESLMYFTDYVRAEEDKPKGTEVASNSTVLENMMALIDVWTSPMISYAAGNTKEKSESYMTMILGVNSITKNTLPGSTTWNELASAQIGGNAPRLDGDVSSKVFDMSGDTFDVVSTNDLQSRLIELMVCMTEFMYFSNGKNIDDVNIKDLIIDGSIRKGIESYLDGNGSGAWGKLDSSTKSFSSGTGAPSIEQCQDFSVTSMIFGIPGFSGPVRAIRGNNDRNTTWRPNILSDDSFNGFRKDALNSTMSQKLDEALVGWISEGMKFVVWSKDAGSIDVNGWGGQNTYVAGGTVRALRRMRDNMGDEKFYNEIAQNSIYGPYTPADDWYTTTVMNRKEQILISWADIVKCGFVNETRTTVLPTMNANGSYEFMSSEGRIVVNDNYHTIQVGTTLYDLSYTSGDQPKLVYIDEEQDNMMYFDYRCVMGVCTERFTVTDGETKTFGNSLGSGNYVVYNLGSNGASSKVFTDVRVNTYNYPEGIPGKYNSISPTTGYTVSIIGSTQFDGYTYEDSITGDKNVAYWPENTTTESYTRFKMNSFVPTANWILVVDDDGNEISGNLYVYYPRTAFQDGYIDVDGVLHEPPAEPEWFEKEYGNIADTVSDISAHYSNGESLKSVLAGLYGINWDDFENVPWYIKMTCEAAANLYDDTDGIYYLSQDYVIRRFDLSHNIPGYTTTWDYDVDADGNCTSKLIPSSDPGAMYFLDDIGFVYNMPTVPGVGDPEHQWTMEKYLTGVYALPLAISNTGSNPYIVNYNVNYYGAPMSTDGEQRQDNVWLPYGVVLNPGSTAQSCSSSPFITIGGNTYTGNDVNGVLDSVPMGSNSNVVPFAVSRSDGSAEASIPSGETYWKEPRFFIPAPSAVYAHFQNGGIRETMTVADVSQYLTSSTQVYYGNSQLLFENGTATNNNKTFYFVSKDYAELEIPNATVVFRVFRSSNGRDVLIVENANVRQSSGAGTYQVTLDDLYTNPMENWLDGLGTTDLITAIDNGASWLIIIAFKVIPLVCIILMTILIGLSFVSENKFVRMLCDKTFDPVRLLTFGGRDINTWNWRKVLFPCILLYTAFALFLNGNLIRIVMWCAKWYGVISKWAQSL